MPYFELRDGGLIRYEVIGSGDPVIVTPGGSAGLDALWPLAHELSRHHEVLLWDRRNTGASDVCFDGASEGAMWCEDMHQLIEGIGMGPLHVLGGSGGSRLSLTYALAHEESLRKLVLWNVVGGWFASAILAGNRYTHLIRAAWIGGMDAVAETPQMRQLIASNPRNLELLRRWEPEAFIVRMKQWARFYLPADDNVLTGGITEARLRSFHVPTLIFAGGDDAHPPEVTDEYHRLIEGSTLVEPARWDSHDWWRLWESGEHFAVWRELAPEIVDYLRVPA